MAIERRKTDRSFKGIELNERNVHLLFQKCIAAPDTPEAECVCSILFSTVGGYSLEDEDILYFSKDIILSYKPYIAYLLGQLKNAHTPSKDFHLPIQDAFIDYTGKQWTRNNAILLELLYLGAADDIDYIGPFTKSRGSAIFATDVVKPTLSPKDPNFPAWWEAHKAEWESPAE